MVTYHQYPNFIQTCYLLIHRLFQSHNKARLGETVEMAGFSSPIEQNMRMHSAAPPALEIAEEKRSKRNPGQLDFEAVCIYIPFVV